MSEVKPEKTFEKYPRLGNYPHDATKKELVEYVEELTDWASNIEEVVGGLAKQLNLFQKKLHQKGEYIWLQVGLTPSLLRLLLETLESLDMMFSCFVNLTKDLKDLTLLFLMETIGKEKTDGNVEAEHMLESLKLWLINGDVSGEKSRSLSDRS